MLDSRPPDFTLIMLCPTIAQPPMPPMPPKSRVNRVGHTLADARAVGVPAGLRKLIDEFQGEQKLDQAHRRHDHGVGTDDGQDLPLRWHRRDVEAGEAAGDRGQVADEAGLDAWAGTSRVTATIATSEPGTARAALALARCYPAGDGWLETTASGCGRIVKPSKRTVD